MSQSNNAAPNSTAKTVVVTGFGCVTALGHDSWAMWDALCTGQSARVPLTSIHVDGCRVTQGAEAILPDLPRLSPKQLSRLSRASRLALPAVSQALKEAGLSKKDECCVLRRLEISVSTTAGGMEKGQEFLRGVWSQEPQGQTARVAHYQAQQQIGEIHRHFGFTGPAMIVANACAGGGNAIGHAADLIRCGMADIVLAGGYEALSDLVFAGFDSLQSLAPDKCRPFDRGRRGLMLGEGAGFLVLENEASAVRRSADIKARIVGYGHTTDTGHLTQPTQDGTALERAMRMALLDAHMHASEIGYVNAHGTGTPFNDSAEAQAFHRVFGTSQTKLSSTKAALGHTLGAAGAIEAIISILALNTGQLPPQINSLDPEPLVAASLVPIGARAQLEAVMSVNLGFGGSNAAIIFTR